MTELYGLLFLSVIIPVGFGFLLLLGIIKLIREIKK